MTTSLQIVQEEINKAQGHISPTYLKSSLGIVFINIKNV